MYKLFRVQIKVADTQPIYEYLTFAIDQQEAIAKAKLYSRVNEHYIWVACTETQDDVYFLGSLPEWKSE